MFPCPTCSATAAQQVSTALSLVPAGSFGTFWLDVEGAQYWSDVATNQQFFSDLVTACQAAGLTVGVYTSAAQWFGIMGTSTAGASFPLWIPEYVRFSFFSFFHFFGGSFFLS
jgi:GH25 family lysozyme M1 (1,4-beta-N-acetylmuramidase)